LDTSRKTMTTEQGGKQTDEPFDFTRYSAIGFLHVANVAYCANKKYGKGNNKKIPVKDNVNHIIIHCMKWLAGDNSEPHLQRIQARAMMLSDNEEGIINLEDWDEEKKKYEVIKWKLEK